jgi:hypothetical protein
MPQGGCGALFCTPGRLSMTAPIVPNLSHYFEDEDSDADMIMTCRGCFVFAWASSDQVIHIYDCEVWVQRPRVTHVEERWDMATLAAFADMYIREKRLEAAVKRTKNLGKRLGNPLLSP